MNKQNTTAGKMPSTFYMLAVALALGFICTLLCLVHGGLASPLVPLSQSPALLAVCIVMLAYYTDKPREKFFLAAFVLFAVYFAVVLAVSGIVSVLPLAASFALSFCAKNGFKSKKLSVILAIAAVAASLASAVNIAIVHFPNLSGEAHILTRLFYGDGTFSNIGYIMFALVPVLFFVSTLVHIVKSEK